MKACVIYSLWLKCRAVWQTFCVCCRIMWIGAQWSKADISTFDKILYDWSSKLVNLLNIQCVVNNPNNVKFERGKRYVVMCNHTSLFDIPLTYVGLTEPSIRMLAKKELSRIPLFGRAMKTAQFPFIDRKKRHQAIKDLNAAKHLMEQGIVLWIAPEGTRSKDGNLQKFKKGAFITAIEAEAIIVPLVIKGAFELQQPGTKQLTLNKTISLNLGKPIDASQYQLEQKDVLKDKTHEVMQQLLNEAPDLASSTMGTATNQV